MMGNRIKALGLIILGAAALSVAGCGKGKESAAVALDEARLNVSSARKAGADYSAIRDAEAKLQKAEQSFGKKKYSNAKKEAAAASQAAMSAKSEAERKEAERKSAKKSAKPKKR
ncbi:MAG: hypothetical protein HY551_06855 [Elusimicrobia bacterium]|nr:hypothetical protein [Elusimicrobiota bacterium]